MILFSYTEKLQLLRPEEYHYLNQSGCIGDSTIDDVGDFAKVKVQ